MHNFFLIALFVVGANAVSFSCLKEDCDVKICPDISSCAGRVIKRCCCKICVPGLGESCNKSWLVCAGDLKCDFVTLTCIKTCINALKEAKSQKNAMYMPICDKKGYYYPAQCKGDVCTCVSRNGIQIKGYTAPNDGSMTCGCAREKYELVNSRVRITGSVFGCRENGDYAYRCSGIVCYCIDKFDKAIGNGTHAGHFNYKSNCLR